MLFKYFRSINPLLRHANAKLAKIQIQRVSYLASISLSSIRWYKPSIWIFMRSIILSSNRLKKYSYCGGGGGNWPPARMFSKGLATPTVGPNPEPVYKCAHGPTPGGKPPVFPQPLPMVASSYIGVDAGTVFVVSARRCVKFLHWLVFDVFCLMAATRKASSFKWSGMLLSFGSFGRSLKKQFLEKHGTLYKFAYCTWRMLVLTFRLWQMRPCWSWKPSSSSLASPVFDSSRICQFCPRKSAEFSVRKWTIPTEQSLRSDAWDEWTRHLFEAPDYNEGLSEIVNVRQRKKHMKMKNYISRSKLI